MIEKEEKYPETFIETAGKAPTLGPRMWFHFNGYLAKETEMELVLEGRKIGELKLIWIWYPMLEAAIFLFNALYFLIFPDFFLAGTLFSFSFQQTKWQKCHSFVLLLHVCVELQLNLNSALLAVHSYQMSRVPVLRMKKLWIESVYSNKILHDTNLNIIGLQYRNGIQDGNQKKKHSARLIHSSFQ